MEQDTTWICHYCDETIEYTDRDPIVVFDSEYYEEFCCWACLFQQQTFTMHRKGVQLKGAKIKLAGM